MGKMRSYTYDVAISYAGEDRAAAQALARALERRGVTVFFDTYEQATLWGKNLYTYLSDLYQHKAHYCVIFVSKQYAAKRWCKSQNSAGNFCTIQWAMRYTLLRRDRRLAIGEVGLLRRKSASKAYGIHSR